MPSRSYSRWAVVTFYKTRQKKVSYGDAGTDTKRSHVFPIADSQFHLIEQETIWSA